MDKMIIEVVRIAAHDGVESHRLSIPKGMDPSEKFSEVVKATRAIGWDSEKSECRSAEFRICDGRGWFEELTLTLKMERE